MRVKLSLLFFLFLFLNQLTAQELPGAVVTLEDQFATMRELAAESHYDKAKSIGHKILVEDPEYFDVAIYLARIYGWEAKYDSAYMIIENVLLKEPELFEAHETRVDLAYWANDWVMLEQYASIALELEPESPAIIEKYKLAKVQQSTAKDVPELYLRYFYDHFSEPYVRNWHMLTVGGNIPLKMGSISPYVNGGYHAGVDNPSTDFQMNVDAYINIGKKNYIMAGYGISPNGEVDYLPGHRAAAEFWHVFNRGISISAGLRYFYWQEHFTFLTISEEVYRGNYFFNFRSYLFSKDYGLSGSYYMTLKRYFENKFNSVALTLGYGTAPDEPLLVVSDLDRLKAYSSRLELSKQVKYNLRLSIVSGYAYEEFDEKAYRHRFDLSVGCYIRLMK